jgi:hypothetical protein
MKVDVAGEAAERKRLGLHKSDGMKNVSKNMGTGDSDSDSDYDADNVSVYAYYLCIHILHRYLYNSKVLHSMHSIYVGVYTICVYI